MNDELRGVRGAPRGGFVRCCGSDSARARVEDAHVVAVADDRERRAAAKCVVLTR
jgi:hypothetical protein